MISAAVICQNEEMYIAKCLNQLWWVDEIVVVDGGSRDNTIPILRKMKTSMNLKIFQNLFKDHFGDQKNLAISLTTGDWVMVFDVDEEIELDLVEELKTIAIRDNIYDAVAIPRKNYLDDEPTNVYPDYQYRFFRSYCRYIYPVHEELVGYRNLYTATNHLLHYKTGDRYAFQQNFYERVKLIKNRMRLPHEEW